MRMIHKKNIVLALTACVALVAAGTGIAAAGGMQGTQAGGPVAFGTGVMTIGRTLTFDVESNSMINMIVIPLLTVNDGQLPGALTATIAKQRTYGEVIALYMYGEDGAPKMDYNLGVTPRSITVTSNFWWGGTAVIVGTMLYSNQGPPYRYTVRVTM